MFHEYQKDFIGFRFMVPLPYFCGSWRFCKGGVTTQQILEKTSMTLQSSIPSKKLKK